MLRQQRSAQKRCVLNAHRNWPTLLFSMTLPRALSSGQNSTGDQVFVRSLSAMVPASTFPIAVPSAVMIQSFLIFPRQADAAVDAGVLRKAIRKKIVVTRLNQIIDCAISSDWAILGVFLGHEFAACAVMFTFYAMSAFTFWRKALAAYGLSLLR